jgi:hypothetical protein
VCQYIEDYRDIGKSYLGSSERLPRLSKVHVRQVLEQRTSPLQVFETAVAFLWAVTV